MPYFDKHFTVEEANRLIPWVQDIFHRIHSLIEEGQSLSKPKGKVIPLFPNVEAAGTNGSQNGKSHTPKTRSQEEIKAEINKLLAEISDAGIVIQDVGRGLIDFPGYVLGEEVFLCYELEDGDRITHWHHLDAGYAGRRPLEDEV